MDREARSSHSDPSMSTYVSIVISNKSTDNVMIYVDNVITLDEEQVFPSSGLRLFCHQVSGYEYSQHTVWQTLCLKSDGLRAKATPPFKIGLFDYHNSGMITAVDPIDSDGCTRTSVLIL